MPTYCMIALGCDKNIIDAEATAKVLVDSGYVPVSSPADADVIVVSTCAFIDEAKEESISVILEAGRDKRKGAALVVMGCLVQRYARELAEELPEVDHFIGVGRHGRIVDLLGGERVSVGSPEEWPIDTIDRIPSTPPWHAFVKVSEGCDNRCSYCTIPSIRGGLRSRPVGDIVREVAWLEGRGMVELNLIAQDLAAYGNDLGMADGLRELLATILSETGVPWIRLLYLHPAHVTNGLIDLVAERDRIVNYLDIPLQHINDGILRAMGRRIDRVGIVSLLDRLFERIDGLFVRTSLIVGFPGEGESEFEELMNFVEDIRFGHVGVFRYSPQEGMGAASLGMKVAKKTAQRRHDLIMSIQKEISLDRNKNFIGTDLKVLVEGMLGDDPSVMRGRFYGQAPEVDGFVIISGDSVRSGDFVPVRITDAYPYDLLGTISR